jgi:propanol-preferring alcohol dehydrogenase
MQGGTLAMGWFKVPLECSVSLNCWGSLPEMQEVVALARSGRLQIDTEVVPLDDALNAFERLRAGKVNGRAVITPLTARV